jgi:hypothetical protein
MTAAPITPIDTTDGQDAQASMDQLFVGNRVPRLVSVQREAWIEACRCFTDHNYQQSWDFGVHAAERIAAASEHFGVEIGGELIALADVRVKSLPVIGGGIAYIRGGPLVRRCDIDEAAAAAHLKLAIQALVDQVVTGRGCILRILPTSGDADWNRRQAGILRDRGFEKTGRSRGYRTLLVDLLKPETELRASLDRKWRNKLNGAEKNGLAVTIGTDADLFERFIRLFDALREQKGFTVGLDAAFFGRVSRSAPSAERPVITLVTHDGEDAAGRLDSPLGDVCINLLAASNDVGRSSKAAYLAQWQSLLEAKRRGCLRYDLGGIDPDANPDVYRFKQGVGGVEMTAPGPFELRPSGVRGRFALHAESLYRAIHGG